MSNIKRLRATFIDKDTMKVVDDVLRIIVHVDREGNLIADYCSTTGKKEVEIKIIDDGQGQEDTTT